VLIAAVEATKGQMNWKTAKN